MARPSNSDERRAQITQALLKVMAKRGYDGASINEIAETAGLSPGLVHYHFRNKQEILLASLAELLARHARRLERRLTAAPSDPAQQLDAFIDFHLGLGADADPEALACWILLSGEALRQAEVRGAFEAALESIIDRLHRIVQGGCDAGHFCCASPRAAAAALVATIHGYFVLAATAPKLVPEGSASLSARSMAKGLLQSTSGSKRKEKRA